MSAEVLCRAASGIRDEWADAEMHIRPTAFYLAVADWLEACGTAPNWEHDDLSWLFTEAIAVARAYLGSDE